MKNASFIKTLAIGTAVVAALSAAVLAQAAPGFGPGQGAGPNATAPNWTPGAGRQGMAQHRGAGPMAVNAGARGAGATLMTPEERSANQAKMAAVKTYEECKAVQAEQHATMVTRATEKGITLPAPQSRGCDMRQARGFFAS